MTVAALFDIDGTIYRDSLMITHYNKLNELGLISKENQAKVKDLLTKWENRQLNYEDYLVVLVDIYVESMIGKDFDFYKNLADTTIRENQHKLYQFTRDRIAWHKEQGHAVIFISGSPDFLVSSMADALDADMSYGSQYHIENKKFTGQVTPLWDAASKSKLIASLQKHYDIDLTQSYAYGDTTGDMKMLKSVGNPTAINPNNRLMDMLVEEQLPCDIVVERKNLIWSFTTDEVISGKVTYKLGDK